MVLQASLVIADLKSNSYIESPSVTADKNEYI